jgi:hypothetical protein
MLLCAALSSGLAAWPANSAFLLGVSYSERIGAGLADYFRIVQTATDKTGAFYVLGNTESSSVIKLPAAGDRIEWKASLGFVAVGMAVDADGSIYVIGQSFVEKLNASGVGIVFHFDIGTGLVLAAVTVDATGRAWVTGYTMPGTAISLKTTGNALQTTLPNMDYNHGFVARLNAAGTALEYATYLGGVGADVPFGIAADALGSAYVAGWTTSADFPFSPPIADTAALVSKGIGFLVRIEPDGSRLVYSVPLGLPGDSSGGAQWPLMRAGMSRSMAVRRRWSSASAPMGSWCSRRRCRPQRTIFSSWRRHWQWTRLATRM